MSIVTRAVLAKAFPNNPRLISEIEALDELLGQVGDVSSSNSDAVSELQTILQGGEAFEPAAAILSAIAALPNRIGAIEVTADDQADIRPIDSQDPASLLSRGAAYTVLVGIGGSGTTAQRPTPPASAFALYFDTTLAAGGKPIFWNGTGWVDSTGTAV
jgi:hypothetical protein